METIAVKKVSFNTTDTEPEYIYIYITYIRSGLDRTSTFYMIYLPQTIWPHSYTLYIYILRKSSATIHSRLSRGCLANQRAHQLCDILTIYYIYIRVMTARHVKRTDRNQLHTRN